MERLWSREHLAQGAPRKKVLVEWLNRAVRKVLQEVMRTFVVKLRSSVGGDLELAVQQ